MVKAIQMRLRRDTMGYSTADSSEQFLVSAGSARIRREATFPPEL
jgi:hypothetical protein